MLSIILLVSIILSQYQMLLHLQHSISLINKQKTSPFEYRLVSNEVIKKRRNSCVLSAVESDSEFEVDPEKAREALRKLDEQLQSLSKKQVESPKIRASDLSRAEEPRMREETLEISGSFLTYSAFVLVLFTIFYNILFLTVIKPAIDGPEPAMSSVTEAQEAEPFRQPTSMPQSVVEP